MNTFSGPVLFLGRETTDGRRVTRVDVPRLPLPVMQRLEDFADSLPIGRIDEVRFTYGHILVATGQVDLNPGNYACGVDLGPVTGDFNPLDMIGPLLGLQVYPPGSKTLPAWPDAHIVVTAENPACAECPHSAESHRGSRCLACEAT